MRNLFYVLTALAVMGLAFWAYGESYRTRAVVKEVSELQRKISRNREALNVLRAEWAYLNRPDRLRELADLNFDRLGLLPLSADQFAPIDRVLFPSETLLPLTNPVEVVAPLEGGR